MSCYYQNLIFKKNHHYHHLNDDINRSVSLTDGWVFMVEKIWTQAYY